MASYTYDQLVAAVEAAFAEGTADPAAIWHRVRAEIPDLKIEDVIIAGRLRQTRLHVAFGDWRAAATCAVQLARDLTDGDGLAPNDAWAFLKGLDHPLVVELVRLFESDPRH